MKSFSQYLSEMQALESSAFTRARAEQQKGLRAKNIPDCGLNAHSTYSGVAGDPAFTKKKKKKKKKSLKEHGEQPDNKIDRWLDSVDKLKRDMGDEDLDRDEEDLESDEEELDNDEEGLEGDEEEDLESDEEGEEDEEEDDDEESPEETGEGDYDVDDDEEDIFASHPMHKHLTRKEEPAVEEAPEEDNYRSWLRKKMG